MSAPPGGVLVIAEFARFLAAWASCALALVLLAVVAAWVLGRSDRREE